jgi:hypothetical protein
MTETEGRRTSGPTVEELLHSRNPNERYKRWQRFSDAWLIANNNSNKDEDTTTTVSCKRVTDPCGGDGVSPASVADSSDRFKQVNEATGSVNAAYKHVTNASVDKDDVDHCINQSPMTVPPNNERFHQDEESKAHKDIEGKRLTSSEENSVHDRVDDMQGSSLSSTQGIQNHSLTGLTSSRTLSIKKSIAVGNPTVHRYKSETRSSTDVSASIRSNKSHRSSSLASSRRSLQQTSTECQPIEEPRRDDTTSTSMNRMNREVENLPRVQPNQFLQRPKL